MYIAPLPREYSALRVYVPVSLSHLFRVLFPSRVASHCTSRSNGSRARLVVGDGTPTPSRAAQYDCARTEIRN